MSFLDDTPDNRPLGYAEGWTAFPTEQGLDILLRTKAGESKGRLGALNAQGELTGTMYEPGAAEDARPLELKAFAFSDTEFRLTVGKRTWTLAQPKGKSHFFAFLNQWPAKAEQVGSLKAMMAALKKQPKA
jgi:hypothetical protein